MTITETLTAHIQQALKELYQLEATESQIQLQKTKKEFEGNITLVTFPFVKAARKAPEMVGQEIGNYLCEHTTEVASFNVVKGFLNINIDKGFWIDTLADIDGNESFGMTPSTEQSPLVMIEYSSPNTNKPLHLGHIRNNLLGYSLAQIMKANGNRVVKTNIVNDRGIHICKSMLAWKLFGNGETPESTGKKGDHLVGDYYVKFDIEYKKQIKELTDKGLDEETAKKEAPLIKQAQEMLVKWEEGDKEVRELWNMMNSWVYAGFDESYKALGVDFDKIYYESNTYLIGKKEVERGLQQGLFYKKDDGSVWVDLTSKGLDHKLLIRQDGTSVYMTQDIGTAKMRYEDYPIDKMIYVVGNEQEYHFKVLSLVLDMLGFKFGKDLVHFSYGMVELPNGRMKSREGTVVDADDLIASMIEEAKTISEDKVNKLTDITPDEANEIARIVALGALKYFILKVDPRKNMLFNPEESIDFNGNTGPFIQYTYARIQSVLRKAQQLENKSTIGIGISEKETELIQHLADFPAIVKQAGQEYSPAVIANYTYDLVKEFNQFYHDFSILGEQDEAVRSFRITLTRATGKVIKTAMSLLGIEVPQRM